MCLCYFFMTERRVGVILALFGVHFDRFSHFLAPWGGAGARFYVAGTSFEAPVAPSGRRFGRNVPTRARSVTFFGGFFETLATAAPKKCEKSVPWEKHQKMRGTNCKKCSFLAGRTCDPYTPAQSKHSFSIYSVFEKQKHKIISQSP